MKPLKIGALASEEFQGAVRWYEERRTGWGAKLFDAIVHATDLIVAHPEIGEVRKGRFPSRQLRVLGFPSSPTVSDRTMSTSSPSRTLADGPATGATAANGA